MIIEDEELQTGERPSADDGKGAGKGDDKGDKIEVPKADYERLTRELHEAKESEKYWSGLARNGGGRQTIDDTADDPADEIDPNQFTDDETPGAGIEGDTPAKLVDELAASGVDAIAKRGFISAKDAQKIAADVALKVSRQMIANERQKMTSDAAILSQFPELKDQQSELFKETAKLYQEAVAMDPNAKKTPAALYLAAKAAKKSLEGRDGASRRGGRGADDEFEESEQDRRHRAASQGGRPGGRGASDDEPDDMLGEEAKSIIKQMGITEDDFKKSRQELGTRRKGRR
jgi:hypothetical protein